MKEAFLWTVGQINELTHWMHLYIDTYIIILAYAIFYFGIVLLVSLFMVKEIQKRKEILQDTHLYKITHPIETMNEETEKMKTLLHSKENYSEEYYNSLHQIVDSYKPHPILLLMSGILQYLVLVLLIVSISTSIELGLENPIIYYVAIGLFVMNFMQKKGLLLRIIISVLIVFVYTKLPDETLLFLSFNTLFGLFKKIIIKMKYKKN